MKKFCIIIFLLFIGLTTQSQAYECHFDKIKIGATQEDFQKIGIAAGGQDEFGGFHGIFFPEQLCKNSEGINTMVIQLFFLKNKLVKISYENSLNDKLVLFNIAENIYKVKLEKNKAKSIKNESEIYTVTKGNNFFFYALIKNGNEKNEYLEIMTSKEREKIDEYFLKMEEAR
jgi:hypothetical protein